MLVDLRGSNNATVKDIVELRKYIKHSLKTLKEELHESVRLQKQSQSTRITGQLTTERCTQRSVEQRIFGSTQRPEGYMSEIDMSAEKCAGQTHPPTRPPMETNLCSGPVAHQTTIDVECIRRELLTVMQNTVLPELHEIRKQLQHGLGIHHEAARKDGSKTSQAFGWNVLPERPPMLQPGECVAAPLPTDTPPLWRHPFNGPGWEPLPSHTRAPEETCPQDSPPGQDGGTGGPNGYSQWSRLPDGRSLLGVGDRESNDVVEQNCHQSPDRLQNDGQVWVGDAGWNGAFDNPAYSSQGNFDRGLVARHFSWDRDTQEC
jgi:hypothetical protein